MSGGAVVDITGSLVGIVVNGGKNTAAILSIENIMENFFPGSGKSGASPAVILTPNRNTALSQREPSGLAAAGFQSALQKSSFAGKSDYWEMDHLPCQWS